MRLNYYLNLYRHFFLTCISESMSFRTSFILTIVMDLLFYFTTLLSFEFLYQNVEFIGDWNKNQFMFFVAFMLAVDHLHMTFISESFWRLSEHIKTGSLDYIILKPTNFFFNVFARNIRGSSLCNTPIAWAILIYYASKLDFSIGQWISLPFMLLIALFTFVQLEVFLCSAMIWTKEGLGINFLRMQLQMMSRYPDYIFKMAIRFTMTYGLPVLMSGSFSVNAILYPENGIKLIISLILTNLIFFFINRITWKVALNHYESASS